MKALRSPTLATLVFVCAFSAAGQTYQYDGAGRLIRAVYADGNGVQYNYDEGDNLLSVLPLSLPPAPGGLSATATGPGEIQLSWFDTATNETGFIVQRRSADDYAWETVATLAAGVTSFSESGLDADTEYFYRVQATSGSGSSAYAQQSVQSLLLGAQLFNISTRAQVGTGGDTLIPGFYISGTGTKRILVRGIGPALEAFAVDGFLVDPVLTVFDSDSNPIATNDDWSAGPDAAELMDAFAATFAFPLALGSKDAALLLELPAGGYTAQVAGVADTTGVGLVEVYDVDNDSTTSRLVNISGRAVVGTGGGILIPGIVVGGEGSKRFLVRAVGPGLERFNVPGFLANPQLTVFKKNDPIGANDDWGDAPNAVEIATVSADIGAFSLDAGSADAAILIEFPSGAYTIHVAGVGGGTGVALVEVYEVE